MTIDLAATRTRLAVALESTVREFRVLASGWETTVFEFVLGGRSARAPELPTGVPLVLRLYEGSRADEKAAREYPTMCELARRDFPTPRPYVFEPSREALGAPFMVMERVTGGPLFATKSFPLAFRTFSLGFIGFVRAQARLHRMPESAVNQRHAFAENDSTSATPLLDRMLDRVADHVERAPLPGLIEALTRLREGAARFRQAPAALLHLDYHPQNVIVRGLRVTGVIDWVNADRGDRHLDAATTAVILACSAMERPRWMRDNAAGNSLRKLFASLYIPMYHVMAPMELERFRYCQAVTAILRLSTFGMMRVRGPESVGYRPDSIENITPSVVRLLSRYAAHKCGVSVSL